MQTLKAVRVVVCEETALSSRVQSTSVIPGGQSEVGVMKSNQGSVEYQRRITGHWGSAVRRGKWTLQEHVPLQSA